MFDSFFKPNIGKLRAKRDIPRLIKALEHKNISIRLGAVEALGHLSDPRAVEPLIAVLQDPDPDVRQATASVLGQLGDPSAVEPLITVLKDKKEDVRLTAASALSQLNDPRAVEPLITLLQDKKENVRITAASTLGHLGNSRAIEPLIVALQDLDKNVRQAAAEALDTLGWRPGEDMNGAVYWIIKKQFDQCIPIGQIAVEPLINAALKNDDALERQAASTALANIGAPSSIETILAALDDNDDNIRQNAAEALGQMGDSRSVKPLILKLIDHNSGVRQAAAGALVKLGPVAFKPLVAALRDQDGYTRRKAVETLGQLGDPRAVKPLIIMLKDSDALVRQEAAETLGKIGSLSIDPLIAALQDDQMEIRQAAYAVLDAMHWQPGKDVNGAKYWIYKKQIDKCVEIGASAVGPLINALEDSHYSQLRGAVVMALGKLKDPRAIEPLLAAFKVGDIYDNYVCEAAAEALDALNWQPGKDENGAKYWIYKKQIDKCSVIGEPAVEPLIAALKSIDSGVREAASKALGNLADLRAVEPLTAMLQDKYAVVRRTSARSLGHLGDPRATNFLIAALEDKERIVRQAAAEALVALYHSAETNAQYKQLILLQRQIIISPHNDYETDHYDNGEFGENHSSTGGDHKDIGIGIDFPL